MKLRKDKQPAEENRREQIASNLRTERYRYHSNRQNIEAYNSDRNNPQQKTSTTSKLLSVLIGALLFGSLLYGLWLSATPGISVSDDGPPLLRNMSVYREGAKNVLDNSLFNHSKLTLNSDQVAQEIKDMFPELAEVVVIIPLASHEPIIDIRSKEPQFILTAQNGAFVVDETGKILTRVGELENPENYNMPTVLDMSGLEVKAGDQVVTVQIVTFINQLLYQYDQAKKPVSRIVLPSTPNELHVYATGEPYYAKFDVTRDARIQAGALFALQDSMAGQPNQPSEYIDVRVSEKAYYK